MIILPTRRRLERRRDALYKYLDSIVRHATIHEVEDIMRKIHMIDFKLTTYFDNGYEATEIFDEKDPFEEKYIIQTDDIQ